MKDSEMFGICANCGCEIPEGDELCADCLTKVNDGDIVQCSHCGRYVSDGNYETTSDTNEIFCLDCIEHVYRCDECGLYFEMSYHVNTDDYDHCVCDDCYSSSYWRCEDCGEILHDDDIEYVNDIVYCSTCARDHYNDDDEVCSVINNYSYKPYPVFHHVNSELDIKDKVYLGFELEAGDGAHGSVDECAEDINNTTTLCYLKEDCSIPDYGFELVTHPCTYLYHKDIAKWDEILKLMRDAGMRSHEASSPCGLHVHVNRNALTDAQWLIVDWFVHRHKSIWERIARRRNVHFCEFKHKSQDASLKDVYGKGNNRYSAINFCNRNTVEFRLFRGTLKYESFIGTLALVDALIHWVRIVKTHDMLKQGVWESFVSFVKSDAKWQPAIDYLNTREIPN